MHDSTDPKDPKTLSLAEKAFIDDFRIICEGIISSIGKIEKKLAEYDKLYKYPNKGDLYSILDDRKMKTERNLAEQVIELHKVVEGIDLGLLIKAAVADPRIDEICKYPSLNSIWNERWRKSGANPKEKAEINNLPIKEYKPQSTVHTFDLLKGIYFYGQYRVAIAKIQNSKNFFKHNYLDLAAKSGHFAALNILSKQYMQDPDSSALALLYAKIAASLYWTPGYLLLAAFYYENEHYKDALLSLMVAEKLIPHSAEMINNAYQGKDLLTITQPLMNDLNVKDWTEAKIKLAALADLPISFVITTLEKEATQKIKEHLKATTTNDLCLESNSISELPSEKSMGRCC